MNEQILAVAKDALHFLYVAGGIFVGLVALLVRAAFVVGSKMTRNELTLERVGADVAEIKAETRKIPVIEVHLKTAQADIVDLQHSGKRSVNGIAGE